MLQVENTTGFVPGMFVFPDADGIDTAYFALKATFEILPNGVRPAPEQVGLVLADEYWGEAGSSSIKRASEAHLCKPSTDIVLLGSAYAPGGRPAAVFDMSLTVGAIGKALRVFGDRAWERKLLGFGLCPSEPAPVVKVPLVYERAFGGVHKLEDATTLFESRNPVGVGFRGKRSARELEGTPLPNIEDPEHLIGKAGDLPAPAGVGSVASSWKPRLAYAGTYDATWQKKRAPYLPKDFDARYFQTAHPDLVCPRYLRGGEPVEIINGSPSGAQRFVLPTCELEVTARLAGAEKPVQMNLETLLLEPDQTRFVILWRGALQCDKKALRLETAKFSLKRMQGVAR